MKVNFITADDKCVTYDTNEPLIQAMETLQNLFNDLETLGEEPKSALELNIKLTKAELALMNKLVDLDNQEHYDEAREVLMKMPIVDVVQLGHKLDEYLANKAQDLVTYVINFRIHGNVEDLEEFGNLFREYFPEKPDFQGSGMPWTHVDPYEFDVILSS